MALGSQPLKGLSPSVAPYSKGLRPGPGPTTSLALTTRTWASTPDFKIELFPLRSPLLWESLLVSLPGLIDMLKFSP
jgi:hypothetical protein